MSFTVQYDAQRRILICADAVVPGGCSTANLKPGAFGAVMAWRRGSEAHTHNPLLVELYNVLAERCVRDPISYSFEHCSRRFVGILKSGAPDVL